MPLFIASRAIEGRDYRQLRVMILRNDSSGEILSAVFCAAIFLLLVGLYGSLVCVTSYSPTGQTNIQITANISTGKCITRTLFAKT